MAARLPGGHVSIHWETPVFQRKGNQIAFASGDNNHNAQEFNVQEQAQQLFLNDGSLTYTPPMTMARFSFAVRDRMYFRASAHSTDRFIMSMISIFAFSRLISMNSRSQNAIGMPLDRRQYSCWDCDGPRALLREADIGTGIRGQTETPVYRSSTMPHWIIVEHGVPAMQLPINAAGGQGTEGVAPAKDHYRSNDGARRQEPPHGEKARWLYPGDGLGAGNQSVQPRLGMSTRSILPTPSISVASMWGFSTP